MSMYVHSSGEIKSTIVSAINQPKGVIADFSLVPSVLSHTLLPVCRFFGHCTRYTLPSIGFLWKNQPLFVVECLPLCGLQESYSPTCSVRATV